MVSNCSFRITQTTEDLAQTITALSQRLIKLEQRFDAIELQLKQNQYEMPVNEIEMLDGIDQQLKACKALLDSSTDEVASRDIENFESSNEPDVSDQSWVDEENDNTIAA
tara:strand:+ start:429 stop:758 length:330 start_codon:yes stop_codon:yes gene_type:complete